ncbi:recombinase family protein [Endozoicomonas sp. Mp262]|uniref:recombinase family protein n=1 Tax=Endozoicomonas sp. Mp262 TaxID=2919499 RepID=UPI0021E0ED29
MAVVAYYRVSTTEQSIENQRQELARLYSIDKEFSDNGISGTVKACERDGFGAMLNYVRDGDTLVTVDIDRLGRDAIDVQQTIARLKGLGVNIIITRLGVDLASDAGELLVTIMSKVAEMERKKMLERQRAGIARAKADGKYKGSKKSVEPELVREARKTMSIAATAEHLGISVATVKRLQKAN